MIPLLFSFVTLSSVTIVSCYNTHKYEIEYTPEALQDEIIDMPDLEDEINFRQFSGYLNISDDKRIFYWYVESQNDPNTDPLAYWTNGGPGCSGLYGFGTEMGPFLFQANSTISLNPYSWNKISNMLFVEQPAGVGFSYIPYTTFYESNDDQAAHDAYELILQFFERFPHLLENDFYITSESYGGHYMPQLALQLLENENDILFKGFAVGNPWVHPPTDYIERYEMYYYRGGYPNILRKRWSAFGCDDPKKREFYDLICLDYESAMYIAMGDNINPYALDYPVCLEDDDEENVKTEKSTSHLEFLKARGRQDLRSHQASRLLSSPNSFQQYVEQQEQSDSTMKKTKLLENEYEPCAEDYFTMYLNRPDVQEAIHANCIDCTIATKQWGICSYNLAWPYSEIYSSVVELYQKLVHHKNYGIKMLIFSGDDDGICPTTGTQQWITDWLKVDPNERYSWREWKVDGQIAGFLTKFELKKNTHSSLMFATVHGAGHEVPAYKPLEAFDLWERFLEDNWDLNAFVSVVA